MLHSGNYKKTVYSLISKIYSGQKTNSKIRGHNPPEYTVQELQAWILSQDKFEELFANWEESCYQKNKKPSVDRLDDLKGYSFNNIRLVTWEENNIKNNNDRKSGIGSAGRVCKNVAQLNKDGDIVNYFVSISEASRKTNINRGNISQCCCGERETAGGNKWKFV